MAPNEDEPVEVYYDEGQVDAGFDFIGGSDPEDELDEEEMAFALVEDEPLPTEAEGNVGTGSLLVYPTDLYERLSRVLSGELNVPFRVEPNNTGFRITPSLRVGVAFSLPEKPEEFESVVRTWLPEAQGAAYKAFHEAVFATLEE